MDFSPARESTEIEKFETWLADAHQGDEHRYYRGSLIHATCEYTSTVHADGTLLLGEKKNKPMRARARYLKRLQAKVRAEVKAGRVQLFQLKHAEGDYSYVARFIGYRAPGDGGAAMRKCLRCEWPFPSTWIGNRMCKRCK
jgi:hypothetical protein